MSLATKIWSRNPRNVDTSSRTRTLSFHHWWRSPTTLVRLHAKFCSFRSLVVAKRQQWQCGPSIRMRASMAISFMYQPKNHGATTLLRSSAHANRALTKTRPWRCANATVKLTRLSSVCCSRVYLGTEVTTCCSRTYVRTQVSYVHVWVT